MNLLLLSSLPSLALCFQPRSTFCLTARAHLNTQKYSTGCFAVCYMYLQMCNLKPRWLERPRQLELGFLSLDQNFTEIYPDISNYPLPRTVFRSPSEFKLPGFHFISSGKRLFG